MNVRDLTTHEAIDYVMDPRNDRGPDAFFVMAANYDSEGEPGEWDGLTVDDVATCTVNGEVDEDLFAAWGPFQLWYGDVDPGAPRGFTPAEALDVIEGFMSAASVAYQDNERPDVEAAMSTLARLVRDAYWGACADCGQDIGDHLWYGPDLSHTFTQGG